MRETKAPSAFYTSPQQIRAGSVVFDRDADMVAVVREVKGLMVDLERPTGLTWDVAYGRLRPGTEREGRQLQALAKLQRARKRGMP
ncbi:MULTISPECIES: hypothetical protein [unclassified Streptomyces]|uniref:hypothetical protein n=1 Tax=unclassified Streptomyces TaxID=2593676 RepID=UPI00088B9E65|nr:MULTISPECIES: hypothetical protein [unclassified Streptomyces]PBC86061.1 hypothetical protein BX261_6131 [Streptomyces sp. 2321.6]SDQ97385.1 hypothetical protein SAMN05216511_1124 [Streptomyces sp. KS_16]SED82763.1 hypothetical protein SAMN05428954_1095 [Streptomyces sp. 2112.3]SED87343.1 hypothetical protein SAMN05428940_6157 [Streptomyces sp. 2133.1]SNC72941.1 hypothetical protein SAMN06272741_6057 [Streptomyces sp. 2114.4]